MNVSYEPLFELLEKRGLKKNDLRKKGIHAAVINRLTKNGDVRVSSIIQICEILQCQPGDIMRYVYPVSTVDTSSVTPWNMKPYPRLYSNYTAMYKPAVIMAIQEFERMYPEHKGAFAINDDVRDIHNRPYGKPGEHFALWLTRDCDKTKEFHETFGNFWDGCYRALKEDGKI